MGSESEIDERTETGGVQRRHTNEQQQHGNQPCDNMSGHTIILVKHGLLDLFAEREQGQEGEDDRDDQHGVELSSRIPAESLQVEREHGFIVVESPTYAVGPEQHPSEVHNQEGKENGEIGGER